MSLLPGMQQKISAELRRREFLARYPDAVLYKNWAQEYAEKEGISRAAVNMRIHRGQLQLRIHKLSSHEVYVIP